MNCEVSVAEQVDDELVAALNRLLPQLLSDGASLDRGAVEELISHDGTTVLVARSDDSVIGTAVVVTFQLFTSLRARLEEVVVDKVARGQGAARALTEKALDVARDKGCQSMELTSLPVREASYDLYERAGFQSLGTTVYRYTLTNLALTRNSPWYLRDSYVGAITSLFERGWSAGSLTNLMETGKSLTRGSWIHRGLMFRTVAVLISQRAMCNVTVANPPRAPHN